MWRDKWVGILSAMESRCRGPGGGGVGAAGGCGALTCRHVPTRRGRGRKEYTALVKIPPLPQAPPLRLPQLVKRGQPRTRLRPHGSVPAAGLPSAGLCRQASAHSAVSCGLSARPFMEGYAS